MLLIRTWLEHEFLVRNDEHRNDEKHGNCGIATPKRMRNERGRGNKQAGAKDVAVYDGAWAEWGGRTDTAIVKDM